MPTLLAPAAIPSAASTSSTLPARSPLSPLLAHLLELRSPRHLSLLVQQTITAIASLPSEDQPRTYEGLLDVARFCIDDEPGWRGTDKSALLRGHPRIGDAPGGRTTVISATSRKEQGEGAKDERVNTSLRRLNFLYERRFPGLRFVTHVAGRPRAAVLEELRQLLGDAMTALEADVPSAVERDVDADEASRWDGFPPAQALAEGGEAYDAEMARGLDALFAIANDRAARLAADAGVVEEEPIQEVAAAGSVAAAAGATSGASGSSVQDGSKSDAGGASSSVARGGEGTASTAAPPPPPDVDPYTVPFLDVSTFRALVLSSPLLTNFFTTDLPASFSLQPPAPHAESAREALATLAAVAVTGGGGGDSTRKRVKGLLGGLLGEVGDRVAKATGRETRSGPRPSFGRATATLEELGVGGSGAAKGAKSALPSAMGYQARRRASAANLRGAAAAGGGKNGGEAGEGDRGAEGGGGEADKRKEAAMKAQQETLRQATQALAERQGAAFVIDETGDDGDEDDEDPEAQDVEAEGGEARPEDLVEGVDALGGAERAGQLTGKQAQLAKDLRDAPAQ